MRRLILLALLLAAPSLWADCLADMQPGQICECVAAVPPYGGTLVSWGGSPAFTIKKYPTGTTSTAGLTFTADSCGVGCNVVKVDTTADTTFYAAGFDYVLSQTGTATSGGILLTSYPFCSFSIANRSTGGATAAQVWSYAVRNLTVGPIQMVSPVDPSGRQLTLIQGDDYLAADLNRTSSWTSPSWVDLTGATVTFTAQANIGSGTLTKPCVVDTPTPGSGAVHCDIYGSDTLALTIPSSGVMATYSFTVVATLTNGHRVTLAAGTMTLKATVTP